MSMRAEFYVKGRARLAAPYHLMGVGLPNIYLLNGVEIENDPDYGVLVTIADIPGLHHAIGLHIATKAEPMTGPEMRFLRKQMQLTQEALAPRLRVNVQTVANYEKGVTANIGPADPMMRMLYTLHILPSDAHAAITRKVLEAVTDARPRISMPEPLRRKIAGRWRDDARLFAA